MRPFLLLVVLAAFLAAPARGDDARPVPRTVLALWDSREEERIRLSRVHTMADMPLNQLGLVVAYWDVARGLPDLKDYPDLRGVLTWFTAGPFDDPRSYVVWAEEAMRRGARFVVLGDPGVRNGMKTGAAPLTLVNRFLGRFGLRDDDAYSDLTWRSRPVVGDPRMVAFEWPLSGVLPGYPLYRKADGRVVSHLVMRRGDDPGSDSHLVVTGPAGGLVVDGYARHYDPEYNRYFWRINPFAFFRLAFATDDLPKPDVTTVSGRRVYFSHIDGDGWRNVTEIAPYAEDRVFAAEIVHRQLIEPYPDLPVAVAPIVADVDPAWSGSEKALAIVRTLFALPQVEPASHTWTHPFYWAFFKDYTPEKESAFGQKERGRGGFVQRLLAGNLLSDPYEVVGEGADIGQYAVPRAFLQKPFDLNQEIAGSLAYFTGLAPKGKPAKLIQWSGDTSPFAAAIADTRKAGARNMNGGDTRKDPAYPSYSSVAPVGIPVGQERQIYSANSNENTYTDLWTGRFFGFQNLIKTVRNTETPIRVKPFNIYYHSYSGQKLASLNAVRSNLDHARASEIAPVRAMDYAAMGDGFYTARFMPEGERRWRVTDRGHLMTLRFDRATFTSVDWERSAGVIGQRHYQGSLYVALDPAVEEPVVALVETDRGDRDPPAARPYLVHGRWVLSGLTMVGGGFTVRADGFGAGEMLWQVPQPGRWTLSAARADGTVVWRGEAVVGEEGLLAFTVDADARLEPLTVSAVPPQGS